MPYTKAYRTDWTLSPPAAIKPHSRSPSPDLLTDRRNWERRFALGERIPEKQPIEFAVYGGWSSDEEKAEDFPVDLAPYGIIARDFAYPQVRRSSHDEPVKKPADTAAAAASNIVGHLREEKERGPLSLALRPLDALVSTAGTTSIDSTVTSSKPKEPETSVAPTVRPLRYTRVYPSHWTLPTSPPLSAASKLPSPPANSTIAPSQRRLPHHQISSPKHFYTLTSTQPGARSGSNDDAVSSQYSTAGIASRQNSYTARLSENSSQYSTIGIRSRQNSFRDGQGEVQRAKRASNAYSTYDDADW